VYVVPAEPVTTTGAPSWVEQFAIVQENFVGVVELVTLPVPVALPPVVQLVDIGPPTAPPVLLS